MRTISFETSKRIAPYLDKERIYESYWDSGARQDLKNEFWFWLTEDWQYPALNLEEALEFLPKEIWFGYLEIYYLYDEYNVWYEETWDDDIKNMTWETLLEAIDKMINHLLDNNLIPELLTN